MGTARTLPPARTVHATVGAALTTGDDLADVVRVLERQRGVIVAGGRSGVAYDALALLSAATGWPILADPCSGARHLDAAVPCFDSLLRHERFAADHAPVDS